MKIVCLTCKKIFEYKYNYNGRKKYCSLKCKIDSQRGNKYNFIHGFRHNRFYIRWCSMKQRVKDNHKFQYYKGRGITICERWNNFLNFKTDMYESFLEHCKKFGVKNTTLERIDNNGDYSPCNCKWTTWSGQAFNRRPKNSISTKIHSIK